MPTVSISSSVAKSFIPLNTAFQSMFFIAVKNASFIPSTHLFRVCASDLKSNVLKKLLIPSAMLYPNCLKSNSSANDNAA